MSACLQFLALCLLVGSYSCLPAVNATSGAHAVQGRAARLPRVLKFGAFNIKIFGRSKMSDPVMAAHIRDIVRLYDVMLIQEIRDATGEAIQQLWDMVGRLEYGMVISERLGRTTSKEEYAYFFRHSTISLISTHQYDDGPDDNSDAFEREPYCILVRPVGGTYDIALAGVHIKPTEAVAEIDSLIDVYYDVLKTWPAIKDVIIMGDLNADCSYASESDLRKLPIYNEQLFYWPLGFDIDTTVSSTDCAYDRFILSGPNIRSAIIPGSEGVFLYDAHFGMSYTKAYDLSDHYPIELEIW
ncbi:deoxyribonuclease-1-like [Mya arenaria]|uniref:deoxyribonuclease-1-like n=1 Tax=Mya arenaria TaxID=6604 RepID=UPI0022E6570E|nr:deoxyribonuclease-1-like [Mya arenaria]